MDSIGKNEQILEASNGQNNEVLISNINKKMEELNYEEIKKTLSIWNSLLSKYLTQEIFEEYKDKKTQLWTTLFDIIKSCIKHPNSKVGIYAWDAESYNTFQKIFTPIIEDFHWVDTDTIYDWKLEPITLNLRIDPKSYIDMRMRMWANLKWRFPSTQTLEDRKNIEKEVSQILENNFGWKYFSAKETAPEKWKERGEKGRGFPLEDAYLKDAGVITDFRPEWSGIWMDNPENPSTIIIINEEDHIRFTWFGRDMQKIYNNVANIYNKLDEELEFAKHKKYGNLGSCPSNIGHMFKSWLRISFPKIQQQYPLEELKKIAKEYGCEIRGKWWESSKSFDVIEVSNSKRFMSPQDAVIKRSELLNRLTDMEKSI